VLRSLAVVHDPARRGAHQGAHRLSADGIFVEVRPADGGRIASIGFDGVEVLVAPPAPGAEHDPLVWGSYPMVPWAGRIRHGRFVHEGVGYRLPVGADGHALHGVGYLASWEVTSSGDDFIEMRLDLPCDDRWPFGGVAVQRIAVVSHGLECALSFTAGAVSAPVSLGWHPWFRKPSRLSVPARAMYRRDAAGIATPELVPVPPGPFDDCFVLDEGRVDLVIDGVDIRLRSDCCDWVVYDEPIDATCIEPQTAPPDAPNIAPAVVLPGATLATWFTVERRAAPDRSNV
jgi:aldose 1-epimerase